MKNEITFKDKLKNVSLTFERNQTSSFQLLQK